MRFTHIAEFIEWLKKIEAEHPGAKLATYEFPFLHAEYEPETHSVITS